MVTREVEQPAGEDLSLPAPSWDNPSVERHPLSGHRYTSREFFDQEWNEVWGKAWLLLGRETHLDIPGSYQVENVGPESIIMVRQTDDSIKAFYNVCQHRGTRLTFSREGDTENFTCPYHGWTYATNGKLIDAQDPDDFPENPCDHVTLTELRCEVFAGFIWVNMDPDCKPLRDYLGPICDDWERYNPDQWKRFTAMTVNVPCNWKVLQDNFCESYHLPAVHPQLRENHEESYLKSTFDSCLEGHSRMVMQGATPSETQYGPDPPLTNGLAERLKVWDLDPEDFADRALEVRRELQKQMRIVGAERGHEHYLNLRDEQLTDAHMYNIFPNCSLTFGSDGLLFQRMTPHPTDPEQCVFDHWYYAFTPSTGAELLRAQTNIRIDGEETDHLFFDYGDQPMGIIPDQDLAITIGQQLGLRSRGFTEAKASGQEDRISWFHQTIDEYIQGLRP
jgi:phenylpropionate dioxygenase-like ring-hydroxylating dioxygenase large terminal subunit